MEIWTEEQKEAMKEAVCAFRLPKCPDCGAEMINRARPAKAGVYTFVHVYCGNHNPPKSHTVSNSRLQIRRGENRALQLTAS